ncbi:MAG: tRNA lysidine(34) synthetase TilS [Pontimonas sp.]|nr:tRNA lysidine(34) synthetase TilS [Pontimonas sp.]
MADVRRAAREWAGSLDASPGRALYLVGLSGGGDSVALAWALSHEASSFGLDVGAVIVDHGLQPGSSEVAQRAAQEAQALGLQPVVIKSVNVEGTSNLEDTARVARHRAFKEALRETGAQGVVLAHSVDDQAETVLLGLTRGSGPSALKGMPSRDGILHRPFLGLSRETLRQALVDAGKTWWEDPHNSDERFTRVRVRRQVLPVLEQELGPGVVQALARTAELFRADASALDEDARTWFDAHAITRDDGSWAVEVSALEQLSVALQTRVLRMVVVRAGGEAPTYAHTAQMMRLLEQWKGQSAVDVSGASVERRDGYIVARASR